MSTIAEIENAIENLPPPQVEELADWLDRFRSRRAIPQAEIDSWLEKSRGLALPGMTTDELMKLTRGED